MKDFIVVYSTSGSEFYVYCISQDFLSLFNLFLQIWQIKVHPGSVKFRNFLLLFDIADIKNCQFNT